MLLEHLRHLRLEHQHSGTPWHLRFVDIVSTVALKADTTTVRIILANASVMWAVFALIEPISFSRPSYAVMQQLAPQWVWVSGFLLHFCGVYWRLFDRAPRVRWALAINAFGFFIWFISTISINLAVGWFAPGTALEWTLVGASAWALYRTGLHPEIVSP